MGIINSIKLNEPVWGENLLTLMNDYVNKHYFLTKMIPFTADIFVFSYPIYLVYLYLLGVFKKNIDYKYSALYIFFSGISSVMLNIMIQLLVDKERPEQLALSKENLILEHVPDDPFPSDHAAMSASIAMATMMWGIKKQNKTYIYLSFVFWIFSFIMSFSRIAAGVHWPTDIIVGTLLGVFVSWFLIGKKIHRIMKKIIYIPLIKIEHLIFDKLFGLKQKF